MVSRDRLIADRATPAVFEPVRKVKGNKFSAPFAASLATTRACKGVAEVPPLYQPSAFVESWGISVGELAQVIVDKNSRLLFVAA